MIEQQRLGYLSALGIETYAPRRILSAAAASSLLLPMAPASANPPSINRVSQARVSPAGDAIRQPVAALSVQRSDVTDAPAEVSSTSLSAVEKTEVPPAVSDQDPVSTAAVKAVRFVLNSWSIADELLVVDSRQVANALPTDRLLQNILWRLGYSLAQLPQSDVLRWPLFKHNSPVDDAGEARAMVQAYLQAQCGKIAARDAASRKTVLLMGEAAREFGFDGSLDDTLGGTSQRLYGIAYHKPWQAKVILSPSLVELLHEPLQKALLWELLCKEAKDK
ncbi:MAG: hypothetical protein KTR20_06965 [Cellvibrionaceae bacterium]|nr:hypothetical protein [Cellvibrionaceae bacterium]